MAQLKEGSIIKKSTGDEIIATVEDINNAIYDEEGKSLEGVLSDKVDKVEERINDLEARLSALE